MTKRARRGIRAFNMIQLRRINYHVPKLSLHEQALRENARRDKETARLKCG